MFEMSQQLKVCNHPDHFIRSFVSLMPIVTTDNVDNNDITGRKRMFSQPKNGAEGCLPSGRKSL
jgi:hypothetical protein